LLLPDRETSSNQREHQQDQEHGDGTGAATPFTLLDGEDTLGCALEEG
jgi:hypothetical protein